MPLAVALEALGLARAVTHGGERHEIGDGLRSSRCRRRGDRAGFHRFRAPPRRTAEEGDTTYVRRRGRGAVLAPTGAAWSASAARDAPAATRPPRSTRCARTPPPGAATPVFFYGFDDLTPLQRDAVETLAATGAHGDALACRTSPAGWRSPAARRRSPSCTARASSTSVLEARAEHYAPALARGAAPPRARPVRATTTPQLFDPDPVDPGDGDHAAAGRRRARRARARRGRGRAADRARRASPPEEIAVVLRKPAEHAALLSRGLRRASACRSRSSGGSRFGHTPLGRGLVALLRCALLDGSAEDLLAYLRTPGLLQRPELADAPRGARAPGGRAQRRGGARAVGGRALAAGRDRPRARRAAPRRRRARSSALAAELAALFAAPRRRAARGADAAPSAGRRRARARARRRSTQLARARARRPRARPGARASSRRCCDDLEVRVGTRPGPACVTVTEPLALRARRVRALFACGLQEGVFPARAARRAVLRRRRARADRRGVGPAPAPPRRPRRRALPLLRDGLAARGAPVPVLARGRRRRRPARALVLRLRRLRPVRARSSSARKRTRSLGEVGWPDGAAPTERERLRGAAAAGPRRREAPIARAARRGARRASCATAPAWSASAHRAVGELPGEVVRRAACWRPRA